MSTPDRISAALEEIAVALSSEKWFSDVVYHVEHNIARARDRLNSAGLFGRRRAQDELLNEMAYGVQNLLRAACLIHTKASAIEAQRAETAKTGSVHESATAESGDARNVSVTIRDEGIDG